MIHLGYDFLDLMSAYSPAPTERISPSINVEEVFASLRDPDGTRHPERWIPGLHHPAIPPRPNVGSSPTKEIPFPSHGNANLTPFYNMPHLVLHLYAGTLAKLLQQL